MIHIEGPLEKTDLDIHYEEMAKDWEQHGGAMFLGLLVFCVFCIVSLFGWLFVLSRCA